MTQSTGLSMHTEHSLLALSAASSDWSASVPGRCTGRALEGDNTRVGDVPTVADGTAGLVRGGGAGVVVVVVVAVVAGGASAVVGGGGPR